MAFPAVFLPVLIVCLGTNFFFGALLHESVWISPVLYAVAISVLLHLFLKQSDRIEKLEKRMKELEEAQNDVR